MSLLLADLVKDEAALGIIEQTEAVVGELNGDDIYEKCMITLKRTKKQRGATDSNSRCLPPSDRIGMESKTTLQNSNQLTLLSWLTPTEQSNRTYP